MALKNYVTIEYLHGIIPNAELDDYIWTGESTSFPDFKQRAEQKVMADMINKGYQVRLLRPELYLTDEAQEDIGNRLRAVIDVTAATVTSNVVTIAGTNDPIDGSETYSTAIAITVTSTVAGQYTGLLTESFQNYKVSNTGTLTYDAYLVEPNYDFLYANYWLYLIFRDARVQEGDANDLKAKSFLQDYYDMLQGFSPFYDVDGDGILSEAEQNTNSIMRILR